MNRRNPCLLRLAALAGVNALMARIVMMAMVAALVMPGCGAAPYRLSPDVADSELDQAIESLRFRVASEPGDGRAHATLGHLELRAGRPGAALRHLEMARIQNVLTAADRPVLASLYQKRLHARLAAGDGNAHEDAAAAMALGATIAPEHRAQARFLAALHGFRQGHQWGRADAAAHLAEAASLAPGDPRQAVLDANGAALPDVATAALWLVGGGALRVAKEVLDVYVARGGRDPDALRAFVAVRAWWGNVDGEHDLGLDVRRDIVARGVSLCPLAGRADDYGCAGTLWNVARGDDRTAALVLERARALGWRTAEPGDAAAWLLLALRGWLDGEGDWDALVRERLDVDALAGAKALPAHVRATVLRVAGRAEAAASALDDALSQARARKTADPGERALLVAEAARQRRDPAVIDALLAANDAAGSDGDAAHDSRPGAHAHAPVDRKALERAMWHVAVLHARALGNAERERALFEQAPDAAARRALKVRLGHESLWPEYAPLWSIARAYLDDPALADRRARDFVDGTVYTAERAPLVAALFASLGAAVRAQTWWQHVAELHPHDPHILFELGAAVAQAGDPARAQVHFMAAAAASGNAGHSNLRAARVLLDSGHALEAVAAARRALALTAPAYRGPVLELLVAAMTELGRRDEADALRAQLGAQEASPTSHGTGAVSEATGGVASAPAIHSAAWNPGDMDAVRARLGAAEPGSAASIELVRSLLVRLLSAPRGPDGADRARAAAAVLQQALAAMGPAAVRRVFAAPPGS